MQKVIHLSTAWAVYVAQPPCVLIAIICCCDSIIVIVLSPAAHVMLSLVMVVS